jgi:hypothetical protein
MIVTTPSGVILMKAFGANAPGVVCPKNSFAASSRVAIINPPPARKYSLDKKLRPKGKSRDVTNDQRYSGCADASLRLFSRQSKSMGLTT